MPATPFLESTYRMMEAGDPSCGWGAHQGRDSVLIRDPVAMVSKGAAGEPSMMQRFFRHNNISSFERQLNYYGFTKVRSGNDGTEFVHPTFRRGNLAEALTLKRRKKVKQEAEAGSSSEASSLAHPGVDLGVLLQRQAMMESRLDTMERKAARVSALEARVAEMEKKQTFLSTAVQDIFLFIVGVYSVIVRNLPLVKGQQLVPMIEDDKWKSNTSESDPASSAPAAAAAAAPPAAASASAASSSVSTAGTALKSGLPIPIDLSSVDLQGLTDFSKLQNIFSPASNVSMELVQGTIPAGLNAQRFKHIAWLLQAANPATPITPVAVEYAPQTAGAATAATGLGSIDSSMSAAQAFAQLPVLQLGGINSSGQEQRGTKRQRSMLGASAVAASSLTAARAGSAAESPEFLAQMQALATAETQRQQEQQTHDRQQQQQQQQQHQYRQPPQLNRQDSLMDDLADIDLDVELGDADDIFGLDAMGTGGAPPISPVVIKSDMRV